MKSVISELFGIQYPIMQGGIQWLATPEFCAAVSNAGCLGTLNSSLFASKEDLLAGIAKTRSLTDKPFAVNISMLPVQVAGEKTGEFLEACAEAKVAVVELAGRDPKPFVPILHDAGVKVIHKSTAVRFAKKAEAAGCDAVAIVGFEAGGHPGMDDVATMVLIPSVVDALSIPVIAGGGICDSRSYLAARALGAQGVVMGTRFIATNATIRELLALEASSDHPLTLEEILPFTNGKRQKAAYESGDTDDGAIPAGECIGRIKSILTVQEVVDEIINGTEALLKKLAFG